MKGHHEVRMFHITETPLPSGWKPFAYDSVTGSVIARKWVRDELPEYPEGEQAG